MASQPSIYKLKSDFLASQTRVLSRLPDPPRNWQDNLEPTEHGDLSDNVLNQVLYKLSVIARKHSNQVYNTQALREVAEQIETLYWDATEGFEGSLARDEQVLRRGTDLTNLDNIRDLPETYPSSSSATDSEADLERYRELRTKLARYPVLMEAVGHKHAYYKRIEGLVAPFENPSASVQPNLVNSTGELGKELEKMRMLAARLAAQIERVRTEELGKVEDEVEKELDVGDEERLKQLVGELGQA